MDIIDNDINFEELKLPLVIQSDIFRIRKFPLKELVAMIDSQKLTTIDGSFHPWNKIYQSRIIEALLVGQPPYSIILDGSEEQWYIINGANDLITYHNFFSNKLKLDYIRYASDVYYGCYFKELPSGVKNKLENTPVLATVLNPDTPSLTRLWVYDTHFIHAGIPDRLWNCSKQIFHNEYEELEKLATKSGIYRTKLFWMLTIAEIFKENFRGEEPLDDTLGKLRFNYLLCLTLSLYNDIQKKWTNIYLHKFSDIISIIEQKSESQWPVKKLFCFAILVLLDTIYQTHATSNTVRFNKDWEKVMKATECKGLLFRNYVACVSNIYKIYDSRPDSY